MVRHRGEPPIVGPDGGFLVPEEFVKSMRESLDKYGMFPCRRLTFRRRLWRGVLRVWHMIRGSDTQEWTSLCWGGRFNARHERKDCGDGRF